MDEKVIFQSDGRTLFFEIIADGIPMDLTGSTIKFAAKKSTTDATFVIPVKDCTITDAKFGKCKVDLTSTDTNFKGTVIAELKQYKGTDKLTLWQGTLVTEPVVI